MEDRALSPEPITYFSGSGKDVVQKEPEAEVKLENVTAKWTLSSEECTLNSVSLKVKRGQLLGVIGPVGCGKVRQLFMQKVGEVLILSKFLISSRVPCFKQFYANFQ